MREIIEMESRCPICFEEIVLQYWVDRKAPAFVPQVPAGMEKSAFEADKFISEHFGFTLIGDFVDYLAKEDHRRRDVCVKAFLELQRIKGGNFPSGGKGRI